MAASPDLAALAALVAAQDATREQLSQQANSLAEQAVVGFVDWYETAAITDWAQQTASLVGEVMRSLAYMVDAYLAETTGAITGRHVRPSGPIAVGNLRKGGVTHAGAYGRVADAYRWQQAQLDRAARDLLTNPTPTPPVLQSPIEAALDRASAVANLDTQLTVRDQSAASMQAQQEQGLITGWRRILHPELSRGGSCGLCVAASTRIYHTGDLMPIHHDCHCLPMPVTLEHDPGALINDSDLGRFYADAGSTGAADLKRTRYQVDEHGELGPVLNPAGPVRTARQAKAAENRPPRRPNTPDENRRNMQNLRNGLIPALSKLDQLTREDPSWEPFRQTVAERVTDLEHQLAA